MINVRRGILVFGCAAAFVAAPLVAASPAVAKDCPFGTVPTRFEGVCSPGQAGGFGAPGVVVPPQASAVGPVVDPNFNGYGSVQGIPCTPENYGKCIALQKSLGGG